MLFKRTKMFYIVISHPYFSQENINDYLNQLVHSCGFNVQVCFTSHCKQLSNGQFVTHGKFHDSVNTTNNKRITIQI